MMQKLKLSICVMCLCIKLPVQAEHELGTLQFTVDGFSADAETASWSDVYGRAACHSVHSATNGWSLAQREGDAVYFDYGVSSPLGFPDSATNIVKYAFAVVADVAASDHATLLDAPCSIRFKLGVFGDGAPFYESQLTNSVALVVNGRDTNEFTEEPRFQLIEAEFDSPCGLDEIYIGGTPATAAWCQSWTGGIAELILLSRVPTEAERNAVVRYLALQHGMALPTQADADIVATLSDMGVHTGGIFDTVMSIR